LNAEEGDDAEATTKQDTAKAQQKGMTADLPIANCFIRINNHPPEVEFSTECALCRESTGS